MITIEMQDVKMLTNDANEDTSFNLMAMRWEIEWQLLSLSFALSPP